MTGAKDERAEKTAPVRKTRTGNAICGTKSEMPLKRANAARAVILAVAAALIIAGIINGSALDVLLKAINLCTECVGLG